MSGQMTFHSLIVPPPLPIIFPYLERNSRDGRQIRTVGLINNVDETWNHKEHGLEAVEGSNYMSQISCQNGPKPLFSAEQQAGH